MRRNPSPPTLASTLSSSFNNGSGGGDKSTSLLRWIAGDVDDMSCGLKQLLQSGKGNHHNSPIDFDSNAGLGIVDQGPNFDLIGAAAFRSQISGSPVRGFRTAAAI
ncbi:hypothetical protein FF1_008582 [Malus domestica]